MSDMKLEDAPRTHTPHYDPARDTLVLSQAKRSGKSTKLIQLAVKLRDQGYVPYIVCLNLQRVEQIRSLAEELGVWNKLFRPVTFYEFRAWGSGPRVTHWLLDDADDMLREMFRGAKVAAISLTQDIPE